MSFSSKCQICVTDKSLCDECKDNPKYYKKLYGYSSPEEVIFESCSCCMEYGYPRYYDDEDK